MPSLPSTLNKTYSTRANVPFPSNTSMDQVCKSAYWLLKAALMDQISTGTLTGSRHPNSVWTCVGSSDGTTAALDGVDRWGSTYDPAKMVAASADTAHSWIILRNATLGYDVIIDLNSATIYNLRLAATKTSSPYIINATPTRSPNMPTVNRAFRWGDGNTADARANATQFVYWSSDALASGYTHYAHFTLTDDGQFYMLMNRTGDGGFAGGAGFVLATNGQVGDDYGAFWLFNTNNSAPPWPVSSSFTNSAFCAGNTASGAAPTTGGLNVWYFGGSSQPSLTGFSDQFSAKVKFYAAQIWGTAPLVYRGKIDDVYLMVGGRSGVLIPNSTSPRWVTINRMILPYVGVPPLL